MPNGSVRIGRFDSVEEAVLLRTVRHCDDVTERMASSTDAMVIDDDVPGGRANVGGDESDGGDVGEMWL